MKIHIESRNNGRYNIMTLSFGGQDYTIRLHDESTAKSIHQSFKLGGEHPLPIDHERYEQDGSVVLVDEFNQRREPDLNGDENPIDDENDADAGNEVGEGSGGDGQ